MENFDWIKPSPLWQAIGQDARSPEFFRPALLEFRTDDFMEDFLRVARKEAPDELANAIARPVAQGKRLKLFQPINQCYYLVCASLCCHAPGFPDRETRVAEGESVFFLLRKIVTSDGAESEYAWVIDKDGKGSWKLTTNGAGKPEPGEERMPMFEVPAANERSLLIGYVPVASSATFQPAAGSPLLTNVNVNPASRFDENIKETLAATLGDATLDNARAQEISLFLLYDLDTFLQQYLPKVVNAIKGQSVSLNSNELALVVYLQTQKRAVDNASLADLLVQVNAKRAEIAAMEGGSPLTVVCDLRQFGSGSAENKAEALKTKVVGAIGSIDPNNPPAPQPVSDIPPPPPIEVPKLLARTDEVYALRCVYERPQCSPKQVYVSQRTELFDLASALDPDGPARQVRVELPRDVSIAGLRKFKKNVSFIMSDAMRNKMARITGFEKALLKDENIGGEGGFELGFICSFSIQIIFIVAFFLLLLFVVILNIVFWWMAFFRICLPIPVKAKG